MSVPAPNASELARALRAGEPEALGRWYELEWPRVYRLAFGVLAEANEADDLAQDAMLHLADRIDRWEPERSYSAWRNRVVVNLGRDRLRRRATRRTAESQAAQDAGPLPDPGDPRRAGDVREVLETALRHLPEREREAFVLVDLEGADAGAAAAAMGVGRSTVRSLTSLARRRLRDLLAPRFEASVDDPGGGADA